MVQKSLIFFIPLICILLLFGCDAGVDEYSNNTVTVRLPAEPDRLNPILSTSGYASQVESHLFMSLLNFDPESLELTPYLAVSRPEITEITAGEYKGGFAYQFEIHKEATWDDGQPVTAEDYIFTMKAILNPKVQAPAYRAYFNFLKDIKTDTAVSKKFTVYTSTSYILAEAALGNIAVYPEHLYDPEGLMKTVSFKMLANQDSANIVAQRNTLLGKFAEVFNAPDYSREKGLINGCGAYQFEEWITGESIVLNRKKDWWGDQIADQYPLLKALPDKIVYRPVADAATAVTLLKSQEIDAMGDIQTEAFLELSDNELVRQYYNLQTPSRIAYYYIGLNSNRPALEDKTVRRAVAHLLDLDAVSQNVLHGMATSVVGPIHPAKPYYHKGLQPIPFDPEKAKTLLAGAGWADNDGDGWLDKFIDSEKVDFEISYKYTIGNEVAQHIGLLLKEQAQKAGIKIDLIPKEFSELVADTRKRDFDLYYLAWSNLPTLDDLRQTWHTQSDTPKGSNKVGFGNARTDAIIDSIRMEMDEQKRNELYHRIQEIIYDEQPYIFLFAPKERIAIHKRFEAETSVKRPGFFENHFKLVDRETAGF